MSVTHKIELDEGNGEEILSPNLLELSKDLSTIFQQGLQSDITLRIIGNDEKDIRCHKAILSSRSKWFFQKIRQPGISKDNLIIINESFTIINAVLTYIYTGNLKILESLSIPLIDLLKASEKYGLAGLKTLVTDVIKSECILDKTKSIQFHWKVEVDCMNPIYCASPALTNFTLHGSDKWGLEIHPGTIDGSYVNEIYLTREIVNEAHDITHIVTIGVSNVNESSTTVMFKGEMAVSQNGKYKIFGFFVNSELPENNSKAVVTLHCELTVCSKVGDIESFELKGIFRRHISNELIVLSQDMHDMLKNQKYADIIIKKSGSTNSWQLHSYIIFSRSRMPIPIIGKLGEVTDFGSESWWSFICFLYTGQTRYLDGHMRVMYNAFCKLNITEAARKYESILTKHLNLNNAFGILCDAAYNGHTDLIICAAQFLASNSGLSSDPKSWISIASDHTKRALFQNRFSFC